MYRWRAKRLAKLKAWRSRAAQELTLDPGVLCPNASLEAIAWCNPSEPRDLDGVSELKPWFVREFAKDVVEILNGDEAREPRPAASKSAGSKASAAPEKKKRSTR